VRNLADGLFLEWRAALPDLTCGGDGSVDVTIPGYGQSDTPGVAQLPLASALVALPPGARPTLEIIHREERDLPLPGRLNLAPHPSGVQRDAAGNAIGGAFAESTAALRLQAQDRPQQANGPVSLTRLGSMRGVALARITFAPVRPVADRLRVITHVQVVLHFNSPKNFNSPETPLPDFGTIHRAAAADPLLDLLKRTLLNPDQVQPAPSLRSVDGAFLGQSGAARAILSVAQPGLTAISHADLTGIGFPLDGVDPQTLSLHRAGQAIAMQWEGDGDGVFDPDERLLFYADPRFSRWTNSDEYFLSVGDQPGLRMAERPANPAPQLAGNAWQSQIYEINALYTPTCYCGHIPPGRDGDRWVWDDVRQPDRADPSYPLGALPALDETQPATLTLWLISYTDLPHISPDHRVDVALNGTGLGRVEWDGRQAITATFALTPGLLTATQNVLSLHLPGVGSVVEGMWLDGFALDYALGHTREHTLSALPAGSSVLFTGEDAPRTYSLGRAETANLRGYDVTNPDSPISLQGIDPHGIQVTDPEGSGRHRYFLAGEEAVQAPVQLRLARALQPVRGADYLIVAPAAFVPALADLIDLRRSQGLAVTVETLEAIYDAFDGRPTPDAIHAYLKNAYDTWNPRPTYLLLVGDGTYDPKRYRADSKATILPPYLADVDPWMGETAADNRYALLDGDGQDGDILPDLLVGRLPVNTITETQIVVNKIVTYERAPYPGGWNGDALFVADVADAAGDFALNSAQIANAFVHAPFTPRPIYFAPPSTTVTATQQAIHTQWNAGAGLIVYHGHSSVRQWAAARLFHRDDVAGLHNGDRLPVVLEMTCFTGLFHEPSGTTLDESLLRAESGGAVAVWGSTGLGVATGHQQLAHGFMDAVFQSEPESLGAGALAGKLRLAASATSALDLVDTFTLLGDPATRLNLTIVPWSHTLYLPITQR
jgi:hypothetical protein